MNRTFRSWYRLHAAALLSVLCACRPDVAGRPLPSPVVEYEGAELDAKLLKSLLEPNVSAYGSAEAGGAEAFPDGGPYRIGPGDSLTVAVYGHPELSLVTYTGTVASGGGRPPSAWRVDNDGTTQFPLIGTVQVSGKSSAELSRYLEQELAKYVKEPKVTVQLATEGSHRYYLMGQFQSPGMKTSDRPLRLLEAMALGGSISLEKASLRTAYVARGNRRLPINFFRLVRDGDLSQNIKLLSGDIVMVPDNTAEQAFVFGASAAGSGTALGRAVPFFNSRLNIVQALAAAGFGFRERFQSRLSRVRVIRSDGAKGEFFVVNVAAILSGEAAPFPLFPGDVVVVPPTAFTSFNLVIEQILPSLQTIGGVLQPFVSIRFLQNN